MTSSSFSLRPSLISGIFDIILLIFDIILLIFDIKPTEDYKLAVVRFITSNQDSSIEKEDLWLKNDDFGGDQVGLRIRSEHEDDCWCTVELCTEKATAAQAAIDLQGEGQRGGEGEQAGFLALRFDPGELQGGADGAGPLCCVPGGREGIAH